MQAENKTPKHWISIRIKPEEYSTIYNHFKATTCNKLSQYVRKVLLQKPVVVNYRNQSADEILSALNALKKELSSVGNNFNQLVHRLHTLDNISEIKAWAAHTESMRQNLLDKTEEIRVVMNKIYEQWSHK
ncbi:MAG: plasmid mobilization relaxosome protein MobC [Arachidicoccus sp.]|nr:plasmid mobilization relaxosome protein MobC [Arachidicoccus sp.]